MFRTFLFIAALAAAPAAAQACMLYSPDGRTYFTLNCGFTAPASPIGGFAGGLARGLQNAERLNIERAQLAIEARALGQKPPCLAYPLIPRLVMRAKGACE